MLCTVVILGIITALVSDTNSPAPQQERGIVEGFAKPESAEMKRRAAQELMPHVEELLTFTTFMIKSINTRQEILDEFLKIIAGSAETQEFLEKKVTALASLTRRCSTEKGKFVSETAQRFNPLETDLKEYVAEFSGVSAHHVLDYLREGPSLDPKCEVARWEELCTVCQRETDKTNRFLREILDK